MNRYIPPFLLLLLTLHTASAEKAPALLVLDRYLGTWDSEVTNTITGEVSKTTQSRTWSKKGTFVISEDFDHTAGLEAFFLMTYDPGQKKYRTCFINNYDTVPITGIWDEATKTMILDGKTSWGTTVKGTHRFLDKDNTKWNLVYKDAQGKVVLKLSAKQTKR